MLDSGTLTPLVKRLESMRHVERRLGTRDERQVQVYATDQGMIMQARTLDVRRYVATQLGMTEEQIKSLRADLMNLIARLQESAAASRNEPRRPADHNAY